MHLTLKQASLALGHTVAFAIAALIAIPASAATSDTWYGGAACQPIEELIKAQGTWPPSLPLPKTPEDLVAMSGGSVTMSMDVGITKVLLFNDTKLIPFTTDRDGCRILQDGMIKAGPTVNK